MVLEGYLDRHSAGGRDGMTAWYWDESMDESKCLAGWFQWLEQYLGLRTHSAFQKVQHLVDQWARLSQQKVAQKVSLRGAELAKEPTEEKVHQ
jgi:hypothetical protein